MSTEIFKPLDWLNDAELYNKKYQEVPNWWIRENSDVLVLLFTVKGVDKDGIIQKFYTIYEDIKFGNLPIEVIYVPMDETEEDMRESFEQQANWFTFKISHPLVRIFKFMYHISCMPHLLVLKTDGAIISRNGILDLEKYGKNAIITWLSTSAKTKSHRRMSKNLEMYGDEWRFVTRPAREINPETAAKDGGTQYRRKFCVD